MEFRGIAHTLAVAAVAVAGPVLAWSLDDWHPEAAAYCIRPPYDQPAEPPAQDRLRLLVATIEALAPAPDPLLARARARGMAICLEPRPDIARGYFDTAFTLNST